MTHNERIAKMLDKSSRKSEPEICRHHAAWREPQAPELGIVRMLEGAAVFADQYARRHGSKIGDDGVLGPEWENVVKGVRGLLNGEVGRLHCGTVDGLIVAMLTAEGFRE